MTILKLKKLIIDDFVYSKKHHQIVRVWAVGPGYIQSYVGGLLTEIGNDDVDPIPLTPEILERNGFEKVQNLLVLQWENGVYPSMIFVEYNPKNYCLFINDMMFPKPVRFLHELHHILMDCGIEKEIK